MLIEIDTLELMELWAELNEAYHGINGFGSDTAEIYAYRFQTKYNALESNMNQIQKDNSKKLLELLRLFCSRYDCDCEVDGIKLLNLTEFDFNWRVQVKIIKKEKELK